MALSAGCKRLVRLIELHAQLRDGSAQKFELGALLIAQFDAPIPSLIDLSHRPIFGRPPPRTCSTSQSIDCHVRAKV
jgi:hypothetical protein